MIYSVHQPQYLPWLGFFDKICRSDCFVFLDRVQYKHREFQNRNKIRTKEGWIWLTVPVQYEQGEKICDVRIDNSRDWPGSHLKSLNSWYGKAPYFDKYFPFFQDVYSKKWERLLDLNVRIIEHLMQELKIDKPVTFESKLASSGEKTQRIVNIAKALKADVYLSGSGGKDYLEEEKFSQANVRLEYQDYTHPVYRQQYAKTKEDFISHLSVVDLLFNEGERSADIIRGQN